MAGFSRLSAAPAPLHPSGRAIRCLQLQARTTATALLPHVSLCEGSGLASLLALSCNEGSLQRVVFVFDWIFASRISLLTQLRACNTLKYGKEYELLYALQRSCRITSQSKILFRDRNVLSVRMTLPSPQRTGVPCNASPWPQQPAIEFVRKGEARAAQKLHVRWFSVNRLTDVDR
jgi:hypothetical protein